MNRLKLLNVAVLLVAGLLTNVAPALASVERFTVSSRTPFHKSRVGPYVKIAGAFTGSLDPKAEAIPELLKVPKRPDGRVEYRSEFILLVPESLDAANRILVVDIESSGEPVSHGLYNSPLDDTVGGLEIGNGFLEDMGFLVAVASWQDGHGITLPAYAGPDGKPLQVAAVGFAAVRDLAYFLRFESGDTHGTENPLAGFVDLGVATGSLQSAGFLRSFVHHGFNRMSDRRVFEALHVHMGGAGLLPPMKTGAEDAAPMYPFTYADIVAPLKGRGETAPRILATNVEGDYYRRRLSLVRTGPKGTADVGLPDTVRLWDIAGGSPQARVQDTCDMPPANLDWHPVARAGLLRLVQWASGGDPLPATRLMPLVPAESSPHVSGAPVNLPGAPIMVPRRDADGNAEGGLRLPSLAVPLGTIGGWNTPLDGACGDTASWRPFALTESERTAREDARPSVMERYGAAEGYLAKFRASTAQLVSDGYLLEIDAKGMVTAVQARIAELFAVRQTTAQ